MTRNAVLMAAKMNVFPRTPTKNMVNKRYPYFSFYILLAAYWRYQTHVKKYRIFSRVLLRLKILVYHCIYMYVYVYVYVCVYIYIYIYIYIYMYVYTHTHTHIYIYIYIYVCIHTHTHIQYGSIKPQEKRTYQEAQIYLRTTLPYNELLHYYVIITDIVGLNTCVMQ